jgi:phage baseplate assembly protein gpV
MMQRLLNHMKLQASLSNSNAKTHQALISSYDPDSYSCKVTIQKGDVEFETGWLPIASPWVGNAWGIFCPPSVGDLVEVHYQEEDLDASYVALRFYNDEDLPVNAPSGVFYLIHKSGSAFKFNNDGSVDLIAHQDLRAVVGGKADITSTGKTTVTASEVDIKCNVVVTGDITASGNIKGANITAVTAVADANGTKTMSGMRTVFNAHIHTADGNPSTPGPTTAPTNGSM